jgi:CHAD domain-containing protein
MADTYRLQPGEGVSEGMRRIAHGQIDLARDELSGSGEPDVGKAVHEARKAFKRVRALLRLARDQLGDEVYRRENAVYRDAGRGLSGIRDAAVLVETLDDLQERYGDELPDGAFTGLRDALATEARLAHDNIEGDQGAIDSVVAALDAAGAHVAGWPLSEGDADSAVLAPGFERIYLRGRRALRAARDETTTENLHELRKRAKDLWHAAQILRPAAPKKLKRLGRRAHELSDIVGEDHDLAVLLEAAEQRPQSLSAGERELLTSIVERRRAVLQRTALKRARRVYKRKPRRVAGLTSGLSRR